MRIPLWAVLIDKFIAVGLLLTGLYILWKRRHDFRVKLAFCFLLAFMGLFFIMRLSLFFIFRDLFSSLTITDFVIAFAQGIQFDLCATATLAGVYILAVLWPIGSKLYYKCVAGLFACIWIIAAGFCAGDLVYFSFVKRHTGTEILLAIYDADLLASLASAQYLWTLILLGVLGVGMVWGAVYLAGKFYRTPPKINGKDIVSILLCLLLLFFAFRGRLGFRFKPLTIQEAYAQGNIARGNLALNGIFSIYKSISKKYAPISDLVGSEEALQRTRALLSSPQEVFISEEYPLLRARHDFNVNGKNFNLVLIVVESWQYKYTDSFAGTTYGATPFLDELAKQGVVFENFYASGQRSINGNGTIMSGVAQLQGLPYFSLGLEGYHFTGLARLLDKDGYRTIFAQPADWNSAQVGMVAQITGFKEIYSRDDMQSLGNYVHPGVISDYDGLMLLADKLKGEKKPFFALFFTAAMHPPFGPLHKDFDRFPWDKADKGYLNTLSYTDWSIGQFIEKMKKQGQYENTIFIVVADHTLGWGESGNFDDRFHIPLLVHAPALFDSSRLKIVGSQADLLPTVLDLLHSSQPYAAMGNSVFDTQAAHFVFTSQDGRVLGWIHNGQLVEHTGTAAVKDKAGREPDEEEVRNMLALNRAVYDALQSDHWARE